MRSRSTFAAAILAATLSTVRAGAEEPAKPGDHEAAVAEFNAARSLFEAGDCRAAIPHFVASLGREQSVGARFNLAVCSAREGRTAEAWNHYKAAEQLAIRKGDAQRVELAHAAAADLDRGVMKVRLVLPTDVPVTLEIDGLEVATIDHWLLATGYALEPRIAHTITARTKTAPPWVRRGVQGAPGVELPAMVVDFGTPKASPPVVEKTPPLRTASYILGGVGIAAVAAGGVFALLAGSAKSDAQSACTSGEGFSYPSTCNPSRKGEVDPANDRARSDASIATVTVISGAVLVAAAAVFFFVSRNNSPAATGSAAGTFALSGRF